MGFFFFFLCCFCKIHLIRIIVYHNSFDVKYLQWWKPSERTRLRRHFHLRNDDRTRQDKQGYLTELKARQKRVMQCAFSCPVWWSNRSTTHSDAHRTARQYWWQTAARYSQCNKLRWLTRCITCILYRGKKALTFVKFSRAFCDFGFGAFEDAILPFENKHRQQQKQGSLIAPVCHSVASITYFYSAFLNRPRNFPREYTSTFLYRDRDSLEHYAVCLELILLKYP